MHEINLEEYEQLLKKLISFKTVCGNHKQFEYAKDFLEKFATKNHLLLTKYDNYLLIEKSKDKPEIEFFTHLDVVPTDGQTWGTMPYDLTRIADKYYGRGVMDDKGPLAAILLLLKYAKTSYNIRVFIGLHEETSFECIKEFNKNHGSPKLGIVADAKFPVIYGEKGSANFQLLLPKRVSVIDSVNSKNTVCGHFQTREKLYKGEEAHSSKSKLEENPIYKFLQEWYPDKFDYKIHFSPDNLGETIYNPTTVTTCGEEIEVYFDVRYTNQQHLLRLKEEFNVAINNVKPAKYCYNHTIVQQLQNCYQVVTDDYNSEARISSAGTYSSYLENTYVFGFAAPGEEGNVHLANENINIDTIKNGYLIYQELLLRLEMDGD